MSGALFFVAIAIIVPIVVELIARFTWGLWYFAGWVDHHLFS